MGPEGTHYAQQSLNGSQMAQYGFGGQIPGSTSPGLGPLLGCGGGAQGGPFGMAPGPAGGLGALYGSPGMAPSMGMGGSSGMGMVGGGSMYGGGGGTMGDMRAATWLMSNNTLTNQNPQYRNSIGQLLAMQAANPAHFGSFLLMTTLAQNEATEREFQELGAQHRRLGARLEEICDALVLETAQQGMRTELRMQRLEKYVHEQILHKAVGMDQDGPNSNNSGMNNRLAAEE